ncbi:MAG: hypothetical protein EAZ53_12815 [Bacteroidetes bacterium]|nr:MAG: hypothetical protein EAZ53_12815 [Bacteroidota bacterium]
MNLKNRAASINKRRLKNRDNYFANLDAKEKERILDHPFIRGVFTEEAKEKRNAKFIKNLGMRIGQIINGHS